MLILSQANFDEVVDKNELVVISFSAHWCAPCRFFAKVCQAVAKKNLDVVFASVDVEAETHLAEEFSVRSVPSVMILRRKVVVYANTGALSEAALAELIQNARSLDIQVLLQEIQKTEE